ncbi:MAG TPA: helix-turn-helix transcriptional regulator [Vicinamibacterales bacterium]|nr:helix-turn-helix transcriptional regulator [Vicinamibacterales bacterium]
MDDTQGHSDGAPSPLRLARLARGMTMADVAGELAVWEGTVARVEKGEQPIQPRLITAWMDALGLDGEERRRVVLASIPAEYAAELGGVSGER